MDVFQNMYAKNIQIFEKTEEKDVHQDGLCFSKKPILREEMAFKIANSLLKTLVLGLFTNSMDNQSTPNLAW